jgi:hypothetical protein
MNLIAADRYIEISNSGLQVVSSLEPQKFQLIEALIED